MTYLGLEQHCKINILISADFKGTLKTERQKVPAQFSRHYLLCFLIKQVTAQPILDPPSANFSQKGFAKNLKSNCSYFTFC